MNKGLERVGNILQRTLHQWQVHQPIDNLKYLRIRRSKGTTSFLPTIMTRLSPFFPVSKLQMKNHTIIEPIIIENPWGRLTITNRRLSIYDETVLLSLLMLLKKYNSNRFQTTLYELCNLLSVKPAKDTYNAIMKSVNRLSDVHITIERRVSRNNKYNTKIEMEGSLITSITKSDKSRKIIIELNSYFLSSFRDRLVTYIDIKMRSELRGDISKA
jgi:hypothetical protein